VGLRAVNKSGEKYNPGLAKRRALFPEGRGLGVGGRKKVKRKRKKVGVRGKGERVGSWVACHQKSPQYVKVVSGRKRVNHTRG
jgi:hypothetical protein